MSTVVPVRRSALSVIGVILGLALLPGSASAASVRVDCGLDPTALVAAVSSAGAGDTLLVSGECTGSLIIDRELTIKGVGGTFTIANPDGAAPLRVTGGGPVRIVRAVIKGGVSGTVDNAGDLRLTDVAVSGSETWGIVSSGDLTLRRSHVGPNHGGILNEGHLVIHKSELRDNSSIARGESVGIDNRGDASVFDTLIADNRRGGIRNSGTLLLEDSILSGTSEDPALSNSATAILRRTRIIDNRAPDGYGGGIQNAGDLTIYGSRIARNKAGRYGTRGGGGIYNSGTLRMYGTRVLDNTAEMGDGGGVWNTGTLIGRDLRIARNTSAATGGGIRNDGALVLRWSSITDNSATTQGGGLLHAGTRLLLRHVTFATNTPDDCSGC